MSQILPPINTLSNPTVTGDITLSGSLIANTTGTFRLRSNTTDGSDTSRLQICGADASITRGAYLNLCGNEFAATPGLMGFNAGSVAGGHIEFSTAGSVRLRITDTAGDFVFLASPTILRKNTSDAADNEIMHITAGGGVAFDGSRGGIITLVGNESGGGVGGQVQIYAGATANSHLRLFTKHASATFRLEGTGGDLWWITNAGLLQNKTAANEATGAGSATLGSNCPAVTAAGVYTWLKITTSDGSAGFIPIWK